MFFKNNSGVNWIVAFLGNPGAEYSDTRHNAGFMTADILQFRRDVNISRLKFKSLTAVCSFREERALLMKPQTYMNLSGDAVAPAAAFYKLPASNVLVVCDDTELSQGSLRIRRKGSAGGHNGLKSIIAALGTTEFPRIKIGIGRPQNPDMDMVDWVIGRFDHKELKIMMTAAELAADAVESYILKGPDAAMNEYNR